MNLVSKLRPFILNFGKYLAVSFKIKKDSCSKNGLFALVEAISSQVTEGPEQME